MKCSIKISKNKVRLYVEEVSHKEREVFLKSTEEILTKVLPGSKLPSGSFGGYSARGLMWTAPSRIVRSSRPLPLMEFWTTIPQQVSEIAVALVDVLYVSDVVDTADPLPLVDPTILGDRDYTVVGENDISLETFYNLINAFISHRRTYGGSDQVFPGDAPDKEAKHRTGLFHVAAGVASTEDPRSIGGGGSGGVSRAPSTFHMPAPSAPPRSSGSWGKPRR